MPTPPRKIHLIAAARPNFMKVAPLYHALARRGDAFAPCLVHTGQHYDPNMSDAFFRDLDLPKPHHFLGIGSGSHAEQTAGVMVAYERLCLSDRPDLVVVVGDVNSTVAAALVATKLHIPCAHLEAGLRSRDRRMPEEINRLVTDAISDLLWTPSVDGDENLRAEGVPAEKIECVGNIMIDSYEMMRARISADPGPAALGFRPREFAVVTLHRPSNVDHRESLGRLVDGLKSISERLPLVFPVHPRTRKKLEEFGLLSGLAANQRIRIIEPLGYIAFMALVQAARCVVTDSGGVQEETTYLGIPCITLRDTTERPITVTEGSNRLVRLEGLAAAVDDVLAGRWQTGRRPRYWDGQAAGRVVDSIARWFERTGSPTTAR
ncbi:MAG: UDP-N-acetylglucosamine 2-epimerase (non-hydrolyzing) [Alphaproteobacteria bacterium]|nr:UDP-N-acetylglucosamine 2-epimerase (non-hydrolyzing) [Alphaproteobacteria bacterium]